MKKKYVDIRHQIYRTNFKVIIEKEYARKMCIDYLKREEGEKTIEKLLPQYELGCVIKLGKNLFMIYLNNNKKIKFGVIAHEAFHAVNFMLNGVDIYLCNESEEVYAYNIEWLVVKIIDAIEKLNRGKI